MKISIIGDGGWGTALAILAQKREKNIFLWGAFGDYCKVIIKKRENIKFLPGVKIPKSIVVTDSLAMAVENADLIVLAVPSQYLRGVLKKLKKHNLKKAGILSVAKGLESKTSFSMSQVIRSELGNVSQAVLSGPNIAYEVARGIPSAAVCASSNTKLAELIQDVFSSKSFRVYTSKDLTGVELSGAFKNIIAIACGISDGLGFGTNTKAALLTRGLTEISRLGVAMGAKYKTFTGLAGMGDLVTTCFSLKSRNRMFGQHIGQGKAMQSVLDSSDMVVEGVLTTKTALKIAELKDVSLPITEQVYHILFKNKSPIEAMNSLMQRQKKQEL